MKIIAITVTDEHGHEHRWEGSGSVGTHHDSVAEAVSAVLLLPPEGSRTVHRSAVSGEFTTAEDAAEHPDTTVREQVDG